MEENQEEAIKQEKEKIRELEIKVIKSDSLKNLIIAGEGKNTELYGKIVESATLNNYLSALNSPDEYVSKILANPYLESIEEAKKNGKNPYEEGISISHSKLFDTAKNVYLSAFSKIKVSDMLNILGYKEVHKENISEEEKEMYMEDYKNKNKTVYNSLVSRYYQSIVNQGVSKAILEFDKLQSENLEQILKEAPKKEEPKKKKE